MEDKVYEQIESFLGPIYRNSCLNHHDKPFITLTFAQSLDGKISKQGQQILISGKESLAMTHRLRTYHDGIMVGIGTALVDDPQLNARFISSHVKASQPQPIVLDPFLKISPTCRLVKNYVSNAGKQPWLVVSSKGCSQNKEKSKELEEAGFKLLVLETDEDRIPLPEVFKLLKANGITTLMVEGGSKIIQSCLQSSFDQLIITIAPMFIGLDGVPAMTAAEHDMSKLADVKYTTLGNDVVMAATRS